MAIAVGLRAVAIVAGPIAEVAHLGADVSIGRGQGEARVGRSGPVELPFRRCDLLPRPQPPGGRESGQSEDGRRDEAGPPSYPPRGRDIARRVIAHDRLPTTNGERE